MSLKISLWQFLENTERYIGRVDKGESFTVIRRSRPVFKLLPIDNDSGEWESVIDFTEIQTGGVSAINILKLMR